ncbi:DUF6894 family protein [Devosia salina]|uniref:DUF6894 domain-containing protein n=1 Tax=Devosia salina TaxID=2860336 RepID=A0ABX8WAT7_9HYPH|nr:hypothetical protein [Devosia salina]QYO76079.1 hypothetical protein K1X15_15865 [Devosia salina]
MPIFFFDLDRNGDMQADDDGQDLPIAASAHREAVLALAEIAAEEIPRDGSLDISIAVRDDADRLLFRTRFVFEPGCDPLSAVK